MGDVIRLDKLLKVIWARRLLFLSSLLFFSFTSVFYALSLPNLYTSSFEATVVDNSSDKAALGSQFGGLASLAGIQLPSGQGGSQRVAFKLNSKHFFYYFFEKYPNIKKDIFAVKAFNTSSMTSTYDERVFDPKAKSWKINPKTGLSYEPSNLKAIKDLDYNASIDPKTSFIKVTFQHPNPYFAKDFLDKIIFEINDMLRRETLSKSQRALDFLYKSIQENIDENTKKTINSLIYKEMQELVVVNKNEFFILEPIDFPFIPEIKSSPRRAIICILSVLVGMFCTLLITIYLHREELFIENS